MCSTAAHDPLGDETGKKGARDAPRFDGVFRFDVDVDASPELITFSKPPLEAALTVRETGAGLRLIGVHMKSKAPIGARSPDEVMRLAIENRQQAARPMRLAAPAGRPAPRRRASR